LALKKELSFLAFSVSKWLISRIIGDYAAFVHVFDIKASFNSLRDLLYMTEKLAPTMPIEKNSRQKSTCWRDFFALAALI
jgi:hypothetical protein